MTKTESVASEIYIWLMLGLFPLFFLPDGYGSITAAKLGFCTAVTVAYALFRVVISIKRHSFPFPHTPMQWAVLFYFIASCLSASLSPYGISIFSQSARIETISVISIYCLVFFCTCGIKLRRRHIIPLSAAAVIFSVIALLQFCDLNPFKLYPDVYYYYASADVYTASFIGTIGNAGIAGAFICTALPFIFAWFITAKDRLSYLSLAALFLLTFVLIYSDISGALIGTVGAVIIVTLFMLTNRHRIFRTLYAYAVLALAAAASHAVCPDYVYPQLRFSARFDKIFFMLIILSVILAVCGFIISKSHFTVNASRLRAVMFITLALIIILSLLVVYNSNAQQGTVYELRQVMHGNIDDSFGSTRILIWRKSLSLFSQYPLLGSGPGTASERFDLTFERFSPIRQAVIRTRVDNAHNEYLNLLLNVGIIGLVPFLSALATAFFQKKKNMQMLCTAALAGYSIQAFFLFSIPITAPLFWLFLGLSDKKKV